MVGAVVAGAVFVIVADVTAAAMIISVITTDTVAATVRSRPIQTLAYVNPGL